jgi:hypothetical protein
MGGRVGYGARPWAMNKGRGGDYPAVPCPLRGACPGPARRIGWLETRSPQAQYGRLNTRHTILYFCAPLCSFPATISLVSKPPNVKPPRRDTTLQRRKPRGQGFRLELPSENLIGNGGGTDSRTTVKVESTLIKVGESNLASLKRLSSIDARAENSHFETTNPFGWVAGPWFLRQSKFQEACGSSDSAITRRVKA